MNKKKQSNNVDKLIKKRLSTDKNKDKTKVMIIIASEDENVAVKIYVFEKTQHLKLSIEAIITGNNDWSIYINRKSTIASIKWKGIFRNN